MLSQVNEVRHRASHNLESLRRNSYPGRIVAAGLDESGLYVIQLCAVMGRSATSRSQQCVVHGQCVDNKLATDDLTIDSSLMVYTAMREGHDCYVASNGGQTDTVYAAMRNDDTFEKGHTIWSYEPDRHATPRITTAWRRVGPVPRLEFGILRKSSLGCERFFTKQDDHQPGTGYYLSTYEHGDVDPLPSFIGGPRLIALPADGQEDLADMFWDVLNKHYRVSLAVKFIETATGRSSVTLRNIHNGD